MAEKLEDLNLPNATVMKIIKEALPESTIIAKDAKAALSRAASVFVLYLTSQACGEAQREKRKTLLGTDVIKSLDELEFEDLIQPLQDILKGLQEKKAKAKAGKGKKDENEAEEDTEQDESHEEEAVDDEAGD